MIYISDTQLYDPRTGISYFKISPHRIEVCSVHAPDAQNAGLVITDNVERVWDALLAAAQALLLETCGSLDGVFDPRPEFVAAHEELTKLCAAIAAATGGAE